MKEFLRKAGKGDLLFRNFREIAYLKRPNHLIQKPIIATLILMHKLPKVKPDVNYYCKTDLDEIWFKVRDILKDKEFLKKL